MLLILVMNKVIAIAHDPILKTLGWYLNISMG